VDTRCSQRCTSTTIQVSVVFDAEHVTSFVRRVESLLVPTDAG
jgi:hypothetical protein